MSDKVATQTGGHITLAGGGSLLTAEQTPGNGLEDEQSLDNISSITSISEIT